MQPKAKAAAWLLAAALGAGCSSDPPLSLPQNPGTVPERAMADAGRGRLLYQTACAACHTEQAHWREQRLVRDWRDLLYQVTRWQNNAGQNWRAEDIQDVAAYLNQRFYRLACPVPGCAADTVGRRADPRP